MAVRELDSRPEAYADFPADRGYRWLELHEGGDVYAHSAIAVRGDDLELHISLVRWGGGVLRNLKSDVGWFKAEARRLGKRRIMGIRADDAGVFDERLFKFARLFGFTDTYVLQAACLDV